MQCNAAKDEVEFMLQNFSRHYVIVVCSLLKLIAAVLFIIGLLATVTSTVLSLLAVGISANTELQQPTVAADKQRDALTYVYNHDSVTRWLVINK